VNGFCAGEADCARAKGLHAQAVTMTAHCLSARRRQNCFEVVAIFSLLLNLFSSLQFIPSPSSPEVKHEIARYKGLPKGIKGANFFFVTWKGFEG
jgi:hypothetical protein